MMISERLRVASKYLKGFKYLADCGTDHALLPIYAVEKGYVQKAIASDNKHHPLLKAKENIADHRMYGKVSTRLAEGLSYLSLEKNVDVVTVLGLGGRTITEILEGAYLYNVKRLILQANAHHQMVRAFLEDHKWNIIAEEFFMDNDKYYQLIVAEPGHMKLTDLEREFGPLILEEKNEMFIKRIKQMIDQLEIALEQTHSDKTKLKLEKRIAFLKGAIK